MAQFVYLIAAMLGLMTLLMTSQRGTDRVRQTQMVNEVSTQLSNAASETLETIGRTWYDAYVRDNANTPSSQCGRVANGLEALFTDEANFGACAAFAGCDTIEGFHDLDTGAVTLFPGTANQDQADLQIIRGGHGNDKGFEINLNIEVQYVDPANYASAPGTETFAKEVTVTAHTADAYLGDDPTDFDNQFRLALTRVFVYGCPTDPNQIPQPGVGQTCADTGYPACAVNYGS